MPAISRAYINNMCLPARRFSRGSCRSVSSRSRRPCCWAVTRLAAVLALLMVLNFHFASGVMFQYSYLTNGYGLPVLGGLLALAFGGTSLPLSVRQ